ncbi:MAG: hypothetical protein RR250_02900 [Akkermansia sp.]
MPTTIDQKLNDDIIVKDGLEAFKATLAPLKMFSTDYSKDAAVKGASLEIPLIGGMTADSTQNDYETASGSLGVVTVSLDGYAKATVGLTDKQFNDSSSADLKKWAGQMGVAVASKVITDVFAKITKANFPAPLTATAGMSVMDLLAAGRGKMGELKVPIAQRSYFPSPAAYMELSKDKNVQVASAMAYGGTEYVRDGLIPRLLGFNLFESTIMPSSAAAPNGFIVHPSALAVATRAVPPSDPNAYIEARTVTDPDTGITMSYRRHYSAGKGMHFLTFECVYGSSVGIKDALVLLPGIPAA